jgi:hypothetical protein
MIARFNLVKKDSKRDGVDAVLVLDDQDIPFELKSSDGPDISTARDVGPEHIVKWRSRHWLFGFFDKQTDELKYCYYASPVLMEGWIAQQETYVQADVRMVKNVPELIDLKALDAIVGAKSEYGLADARNLLKSQKMPDGTKMGPAKYREYMDRTKGFSRQRMLELVRLRCYYLLDRGATRNNPHIPSAYFRDWAKIGLDGDYAGTLRKLVREALAKA